MIANCTTREIATSHTYQAGASKAAIFVGIFSRHQVCFKLPMSACRWVVADLERRNL
jgi:hypothetical protein